MCSVAKDSEAPRTLKDAGHPSWRDEADSDYAHAAERSHVFHLIRLRYTASDLDSAVQDAKLLEAFDINNAGIEAQLSYLNAVYGIEWLRTTFNV
jgi:hypothetical protein